LILTTFDTVVAHRRPNIITLRRMSVIAGSQKACWLPPATVFICTHVTDNDQHEFVSQFEYLRRYMVLGATTDMANERGSRGTSHATVGCIVTCWVLLLANHPLPASGMPSVATVVTGLCNITSVQLVADFDGTLLNRALQTRLSADIAKLSPTIAAADLSSSTLLVLDGGCNAILSVPRNNLTNLTARRNPLEATALAVAAGLRSTSGGAADGSGIAARFRNPAGMAVVARGEVLIVDTGNHAIRRLRLTARMGDVTTIAGNLLVPGDGDGNVISARFRDPVGIATDVRQSAGAMTATVFVADRGNGLIRSFVYDVLSGTAGGVSTVAGLRGARGIFDGPVATALIDMPTGIAVTAVPSSAVMIFFTEWMGRVVRRVDVNAGTVTTIAGSGALAFGDPRALHDAVGSAASFGAPCGLTLRGDPLSVDGPLYLADVRSASLLRLAQLESSLGATVEFVTGGRVARNSSAVRDGSQREATFTAPYSAAYYPAAQGASLMDIFRVSTLWVMDHQKLRVVIDEAALVIPLPNVTSTQSRTRLPTVSQTVSATSTLRETETRTFGETATHYRFSSSISETLTLTLKLVDTNSATIPLPTSSATDSASLTYGRDPVPPRIRLLAPAVARALARDWSQATATGLAIATEVLAIVTGLSGYLIAPLAAERQRALFAVMLCPLDRGVEVAPSRGVHWFAFFTMTAASEFSQRFVVTLLETAIVSLGLLSILVSLAGGCSATLRGPGHATAPSSETATRANGERSETFIRVMSTLALGVVVAWSGPALGSALLIAIHTYVEVERIVACVVVGFLLILVLRVFSVTAAHRPFDSHAVTATTIKLPHALESEILQRDDLNATEKEKILRLAAGGMVPGSESRIRWFDRDNDVLFLAHWHALFSLSRDPREWLSRNYVAIEFAAALFCVIFAAIFPSQDMCEAPLFPAVAVALFHVAFLAVGMPYRRWQDTGAMFAFCAVDLFACGVGFYLQYGHAGGDDALGDHLVTSMGAGHVVCVCGTALYRVATFLETAGVFSQSRVNVSRWRTNHVAHEQRDKVTTANDLLSRASASSAVLVPPSLTGASPVLTSRTAAQVVWEGQRDAYASLGISLSYPPELQRSLLTSANVEYVVTGYDHRRRAVAGPDVDDAGQGALPVPLLSALHARRRYETEFATGVREIVL
jgi:hypothetical protein